MGAAVPHLRQRRRGRGRRRAGLCRGAAGCAGAGRGVGRGDGEALGRRVYAEGLAEDEANIDYAFDLGEFFATKDNGFFEHEAEVIKFLDCLTANEKYPFSTPELRDEIRHSFWLLDRVASAKALERLLKKHEAFKDYTVVLAAGDGCCRFP